MSNMMESIPEADLSMENSERESMKKQEKGNEKEENANEENNNQEIGETEPEKQEGAVPKERFTQLEDTFLQNQSQLEGMEEENENNDTNTNTNIDTNNESNDTNNNLCINKEDNSNRESTKGNKKKEEKSKEDKIQEYKIIVLGDLNVGKSSLINRYLLNSFNKTGKNDKIKPENNIKKMKIDDDFFIKLNIWDTKGEEEFNNKLTRHYYKDAYGALIVFDLTNKESFKKIKNWIEELKDNSPRDLVYCILGNKADLENKREVSYEEAKNFADDNLYYEVSAKNGNNVALGFEQLVYNIVDKQSEEQNNPDRVLRGKEGRKTTEINFPEEIKDIKTKNKKCC